MSLRPLVPVLALALLAVPGVDARADNLNGGVVSLKIKLPPESGGGAFTEPTDTYKLKYFNAARCACDAGGDDQLYRIEYTWATMPAPAASHQIDVWTGVGCKTALDTEREMKCVRQEPILDPTQIDHTVQREYHVSDLVLNDTVTSCPDAVITGEHWAVTEDNGHWDDMNQTQLSDADAMTTGLKFDMQAPPLPSSLTPVAREGGLALEWPAIVAMREDIKVFQALCARADGSVAHSSPTNTREYETPRTLCGGTDVALTKASLNNAPGDPVGEPPVQLQQLNPMFLCGQAEKSANGITLDGLVDDEPYWVVLLSVDASGNVSGTYIDRPLTPKSVIDFWEELNAENGNVRGGFCVAQVGGDGALGSALLVLAAGLIVTRRRRRRSKRLARLITLAIVLAPAVASAQNSFSPYWQDDDQGGDGMPEPHWNIGLRLGPYTPSIDDNFDSNPGPYARTFKNQGLMFGLDVHRVWSLARGQLGIGGSAGYFTNSALAFDEDTTRFDPNRTRAEGNITRLSILPLQLTAIYRATIFDDEMGIPVVPYLRAGLGYYIWWSRAPSGDLSVAKSCESCEDRALGASIGVTGAVGLAIRAERIDGDAARSMQDSGLEHAGFFAELEGGWVDGFGNDKKLSLGDITWFGGINFEF